MEKNQNVYIEEGVYHIRKIKSCRVTGTLGLEICARCRIKELGTYEYLYDPKKRILRRPYRGKHKEYVLDENAADTLMKEYYAFTERVKKAEDAENREDISVEFTNISEVFSLIRTGEESFTYLREVVYKEDGFIGARELEEDMTLSRFIGRLASEIGDLLPDPGDDGSGFKEMERIIRSREPEDICRNPLFSMAEKYGDELLEKQLKVYYGTEDEDDCRWLECRLGKRILPRLPGEERRPYCVLRETMSSEDMDLLDRSGYRIYHKPYFALKGYTKSAWTLYPCSKEGRDAAPVGSEMISFSEFLEMFGKD